MNMGSPDEGRDPQNYARDSLPPGDAGMMQAMAQKKDTQKDTLPPDADPISAALRKIHDSVLEEPLPDDFLDLLDQIDQKISAAAKGP